MLAYPTNPWVDWERECFLNFRDSERVDFLPNADVSQVCEKCVCVVSVGVLALVEGDHTTRSLSRSDTGFGSLATNPPSCGAGNLNALSQVDFVSTSDDIRIDVLHIVPNVCFHVLPLMPCILASASIFLGLPRRHHQACDTKELR